MSEQDQARVMRQQTSPSEKTAFMQIVVGFILLWVPAALAGAIRRHLGLDGLVMAGWCSLGFSVLSIGLLWMFSLNARQACRAVRDGLKIRTTRFWILGLVIGNALLAGLVFLLYKMQLAPTAVGADVGWAHYLGLPPDRRPDFLLHYLLLSAVDMVVTGPIAEELFHIGVVVGVLRKHNIPWPWIAAFDALLFIILHQGQGGEIIGFVPMLRLGIARLFLDYLYYKTDSIAVPIVAHSLNNLRVLSISWFPLLP